MCNNCTLIDTFANLLKNTLTYLFKKLEIYDMNDKRLPQILSEIGLTKEQLEVMEVLD